MDGQQKIDLPAAVAVALNCFRGEPKMSIKEDDRNSNNIGDRNKIVGQIWKDIIWNRRERKLYLLDVKHWLDYEFSELIEILDKELGEDLEKRDTIPPALKLKCKIEWLKDLFYRNVVPYHFGWVLAYTQEANPRTALIELARGFFSELNEQLKDE